MQGRIQNTTLDLVHGPFRGPGPWTIPVDHLLFQKMNFTTGLSKLQPPSQIFWDWSSVSQNLLGDYKQTIYGRGR